MLEHFKMILLLFRKHKDHANCKAMGNKGKVTENITLYIMFYEVALFI